jgi:hypothetical protein
MLEIKQIYKQQIIKDVNALNADHIWVLCILMDHLHHF